MPSLWLTLHLLLICRAPAQDAPAATDPPPDPVEKSEPALEEAPPEGDPAPAPDEGPTENAEESASGAPEQPEETPTEPLPPRPIATELERAKEAYFDGGHSEAIDILKELQSRIDGGEVVSSQTRGDVGIYLGELLLLIGEQEAAWQTFRWLLVHQPDTPILPALHPPEVVSWFEAARAEVRAEIEANRPPPPPVMVPAPYPWWGYMPFGAPQLAQGMRGRGSAFAVGQSLSAGASIGMFAHLLVVNRRQHPDWLSDDEVGPYVRRWRNTVQWPATALFYTLWVASVADGRGAWKRAGHRIELAPSADGAELRIRGRF